MIHVRPWHLTVISCWHLDFQGKTRTWRAMAPKGDAPNP